MGLTIGNSDNNSVNEVTKQTETERKQVDSKPNTIFSVEDLDVNKDGKIDNKDFNSKAFINKFKNLGSAAMKKIEDMYIEYALKQPNNRRTAGSLMIVEFDMPFSMGASRKKQFILDKKSGKVILEKSIKTTEKDGITSVEISTNRYNKNKVKNHEVKFQYDKQALENYVINEAKDKKGNDITYFDSIPKIRALPENQRTEAQKKLLKEFDNMIEYTIQSGIDYGVDPKLILSVIQQEVGFKGLSSNVTGKNGKGYMQLTSAPINDYLGLSSDRQYHEIKDFLYGPETEELLSSRGFEPRKAQTQAARRSLYKNIYNHLLANKDPEFNIRLGTLVLRYYLDKTGGNVSRAAKLYNGSSLKEEYARHVDKYNTLLRDTVKQDTIYNYKQYNIAYMKKK